MSRRSLGLQLAAAAAAFAALSVLVASGAVRHIDQWGVDHTLRNITHAGSPTLAGALVPLLHTDFGSAVDVVAGVVTAPASFLLSLAVVGACCATLRRRGRARAAYAWAAAWLAGNVVEELCKSVLTRPALHRHGLHLVGFDSSFPSGHTIRSILVAATLATTWRAVRGWAAVWAAATLVLLELDALHTLSDIAGGVLVAALLVQTARGFG